jgi:hypothetical protein
MLADGLGRAPMLDGQPLKLHSERASDETPAAPTPVEPLPLLISAAIAATLCGVSLASWHRYVSPGKIGPEAVRLGGRVLYRRQELVDWVAAGTPDRRTWQALVRQRDGKAR